MNNIKKIVFSCVKNIGKEHKNKKLMLPNDNKVSAGSVVYKGIKENSIYLGNPAKYIGKNKI